jgi:hypothetical protein
MEMKGKDIPGTEKKYKACRQENRNDWKSNFYITRDKVLGERHTVGMKQARHW